MGLCCLGGLRGLCGFCTRVELGGYMACGVFALLFPCLPSFLSFAFPFLFLLCSSCLLLVLFPCLSCFVFVAGVAFSLSDVQTKRKGAPCGASSLVLLWAYL